MKLLIDSLCQRIISGTQTKRAFCLALGVLSINAAVPTAQAASQTWTGASTTSGTWSDTTNWNGGAAPGSLGTTNSTDVVTFNSAIANTWGNAANNPIVIDAGRNIKSLLFDTNAGNYFIGSTTGNILTLTVGGTLGVLSTAVGTNMVETINAPLKLAGNYQINNSRADTGSAIVISGSITNAANGTLTFAGAGTGTGNSVSGNITDGTGTQNVAFTHSAGKWTLSGANNYNGLTSITSNGGTTVMQGSNSSSTGVTTLNNANALLQFDSASNGGLASGTLNLTAGKLEALTTTRSLSNPITLTAVTVQGSQSINFDGKLTGATGAGRTLTNNIGSGKTLTLSNVDINADTSAIRTLTLAGSGNTTITGTIANAPGTAFVNHLTVTNTGTTTLSGLGSFTGVLSATNANINLSGTLNGPSGISLTGGVFSQSANGAIGGAASFTLGSGSATLAGANTYSDVTTVNGGTLQIGNGGTTGSLSSSSAISVASGATLAFNRTDDYGGSFANAISGAGGIKLASGTLTFADAKAYAGSTTVAGGLLVAGIDNAFGASAALAVNAGIVNLAGYNMAVGALSGSSGAQITTAATSGTATLSASFPSGTSTYVGTINDNGVGMIALTKAGAGTQVLSGSNSYTGVTTIGAGVLQAGHANALGNGDIKFTGGTLQYTTASSGQDWSARFKNSTSPISLDTNGQDVTLAGTIDSGNVGGMTKSNGGTLTLSGLGNFGGTFTQTSGTTSLTGTLNGPSGISISGASTLFTQGQQGSIQTGVITITDGTVTLSGSNSYTGNTTMSTNRARLNINNPAALGSGTLVTTTLSEIANTSGSPVTLANNNNFRIGGDLYLMAGSNLSLGDGVLTLNGSRAIDVTPGLTLTIGSLAATGSAVTLTRWDSGTLVVRNAADPSFQGGIDAQNGGGLHIGHKDALGSGPLTATNIGSFQAINPLTGPISVSSVAVVNGFTVGGTNSIEFAGKVFGSGAASRTITSNISGGTLTMNDVAITSDTTSARSLTIAGSGNTTIKGVISNGGGDAFNNSLSVTSTGTTTLSGTGTYTGATTLNAAAGTLVLAGLNAGNGAITLTTGTLVCSGTYSGAGSVTLTNGRLQLNSAANGGLPSGTLTLTAGTLEATGASRSISNAVTMTAVTVEGSQGLTITGSFFGATGNGRTLTNNGTLTINDMGLNADTGTNRTLTLAGNGITNLGNIANGATGRTNSLTITNTGTTTISGNCAYTGTTSIKRGLVVVTGSLSASAPVIIGDSASPTSAAILAGSGTMGNVTVGASAANSGARIAPGTPTGIGALNAANLTFSGSLAHLDIQLAQTSAGNPVAGADHSALLTSGTISLAGADLALSLPVGFVAGGDALYCIINNGSAQLGGSANLGQLSYGGTLLAQGNTFTVNGQDFQISYTADFSGSNRTFAGSGNDVALLAVPEPGSVAMVVGGCGMLLFIQRLRRRGRPC